MPTDMRLLLRLNTIALKFFDDGVNFRHVVNVKQLRDALLHVSQSSSSHSVVNVLFDYGDEVVT